VTRILQRLIRNVFLCAVFFSSMIIALILFVMLKIHFYRFAHYVRRIKNKIVPVPAATGLISLRPYNGMEEM
jgi:hypothetical protein